MCGQQSYPVDSIEHRALTVCAAADPHHACRLLERLRRRAEKAGLELSQIAGRRRFAVLPAVVCPAMPTTRISVPADGGQNTWWAESIALRPVESDDLVLDLSDLEMVDPLFVARLRGLIDLHADDGRQITVVPPRKDLTRKYLEFMQLACELPSNCECELGSLEVPGSSRILIPIRRLSSPGDVEDLERALGDLYLAHFSGPLAKLAEAFTRTVGEISDNATTHGKSPVGVSYVAAHRFPKGCILAVGDVGIGIPAHMRKAFPELEDDGDAIRVATHEGKSGTGDPQRGIGYQYVIDGLKNEHIATGELRVWSGRGRFRVLTMSGLQMRRRAWTVDEATVGTWVRVDLAGQ